MSILRAASLLAGGSTVAGAGLAAGRDVYQGAKRNFGFILVLILVGSALYGSYKAGSWCGRNYPNWFAGFLARVGALIVLGVCWLGTIVVGEFLVPTAFLPYPYPTTLPDYVAHLLTFDTLGGTVTLSMLGLAGLGVLRGLGLRRGRRRQWEADAHNVAFFADQGLREVQDDRLRDRDDNGYQLKNVLPGELEFKALGHRSMYAYLTFDETGKFTAWSGLVPQR